MLLFALKCDQGYLRNTESSCQCVPMDKATVVPEHLAASLDALAEKAFLAGCQNVFLIELHVIEGNCVKKW